MEEIKKILEEIMDYQMNNVQLARTTKPYLLAKKGLEILKGTEINKLNKSDVISSVCEHEKTYYCLVTGGMRCRKCKRCL